MRGAFGFVVSLVLVLGVIGVVILGFQAKDVYDQRQATPMARANWRVVRAEVAKRVVQGGRPLQLGAVWMTHAGRICGLVNGGTALAGETGMAPFYQDGGAVRFTAETDERAFADAWRACDGDIWLQLHHGSYEARYCVTLHGLTRCHVESLAN